VFCLEEGHSFHGQTVCSRFVRSDYSTHQGDAVLERKFSYNVGSLG
jgi:hypothetical protein